VVTGPFSTSPVRRQSRKGVRTTDPRRYGKCTGTIRSASRPSSRRRSTGRRFELPVGGRGSVPFDLGEVFGHPGNPLGGPGDRNRRSGCVEGEPGEGPALELTDRGGVKDRHGQLRKAGRSRIEARTLHCSVPGGCAALLTLRSLLATGWVAVGGPNWLRRARRTLGESRLTACLRRRQGIDASDAAAGRGEGNPGREPSVRRAQGARLGRRRPFASSAGEAASAAGARSACAAGPPSPSFFPPHAGRRSGDHLFRTGGPCPLPRAKAASVMVPRGGKDGSSWRSSLVRWRYRTIVLSNLDLPRRP